MERIVDKIYEDYEKLNEEPPRSYLGASQIGAECDRATWYSFRWFKKILFSGRMQRLFDTGKLEEDRFVRDLENVGVRVSVLDPSTGKQYRVETFEAHFSGSTDGVATHICPTDPEKQYILEFKTHNEKSFSDLKDKGVKGSKIQHYAQLQIYMGLFGIHQAYYLAKNKNTDELYEEYIDFARDEYNYYMQKARSLILSQTPPNRINESPSYYKCKYCDFKDICHAQNPFNQNCRTCINSRPAKGGMWKCKAKDLVLDVDKQMEGCHDKYEPITK